MSGWNKSEYDQMGIWPGDDYFERRYDYTTEYVQIMKELWNTGQSDFKGDFFEMDDCRMLPMPKGDIKLVSAGQSPRGMRFTAEECDHNFIIGDASPEVVAGAVQGLAEAAASTGRDVGSYVLFIVVMDETDEAAEAKVTNYREGADLGRHCLHDRSGRT